MLNESKVKNKGLRTTLISSSQTLNKRSTFLLNDYCYRHIENNLLICWGIQLIGFYIMGTLVVNGLIQCICLLTSKIFRSIFRIKSNIYDGGFLQKQLTGFSHFLKKLHRRCSIRFQLTFTCSKSIIEALEKGVKYVHRMTSLMSFWCLHC